jgi:SHS2 domain-containing protein
MADTSYSYFDHDADIGVTGHGPTLEAAFQSAASGMFAIMADPAEIKPTQSVRFEFEEDDVELALVTWLNNLLSEARSAGLIFSRFQLQRERNRWSGQAWGEPWQPGIERGTEVKGATLTMLKVREKDGQWEAGCIVDV